jgi:hypothetical protein
VRQLGLATGWALGASSRPFCWGGGALGMWWPIGGSSTADTSGPSQEWSVDPIGGSSSTAAAGVVAMVYAGLIVMSW